SRQLDELKEKQIRTTASDLQQAARARMLARSAAEAAVYRLPELRDAAFAAQEEQGLQPGVRGVTTSMSSAPALRSRMGRSHSFYASRSAKQFGRIVKMPKLYPGPEQWERNESIRAAWAAAEWTQVDSEFFDPGATHVQA